MGCELLYVCWIQGQLKGNAKPPRVTNMYFVINPMNGPACEGAGLKENLDVNEERACRTVTILQYELRSMA